jgi:hypothetical protein
VVLKQYSTAIDEVEEVLFGEFKLTAQLRRDLRSAVELMYEKIREFPTESAVVITGMGEEDPFPVLLEYSIAGVALDKLRSVRKGEAARITNREGAYVAPFAQKEIIDTIINGINPRLDEALNDVLRGRKREWFGECVSEYEQGFMTSVSALPRQDLAKMAAALVSLTAFVKRIRADEDDTVAEPIDVAILSKGDGFAWVKHKDLVQEFAQT